MALIDAPDSATGFPFPKPVEPVSDVSTNGRKCIGSTSHSTASIGVSLNIQNMLFIMVTNWKPRYWIKIGS